jgi:hypothetical protein
MLPQLHKIMGVAVCQSQLVCVTMEERPATGGQGCFAIEGELSPSDIYNQQGTHSLEKHSPQAPDG